MPSGQRLPFEPNQNRKKPEKSDKSDNSRSPAKAREQVAAKPQPKAAPTPVTTSKPQKKEAVDRNSMAIPEVVSQRMVRRMALFCGLPTSLGMATFVASYLVVSQHWFNLPNVAVVLVSMGFFGLGVLGLTYGILSASWDEQRPGSLLGTEEFGLNFSRMREAWKESRQKS